MRLLLLLTLFLAASCSVTVPEVPICSQLSVNEGYCVNTYSGKSQIINDTTLLEGKTWWDLKATSLVLPASSWKKIKQFIIEVCTKTKKCNENLSGWDRTVKDIDGMVTK